MLLLFTERSKTQVRAHVANRVAAMRGVRGVDLTATSDGSLRRIERDSKMGNKDVIECAQDPKDEGCCQEGQEAEEERVSTGGHDEQTVDKSGCEEGGVLSSTGFNPESNQQSPDTTANLNLLNASSQSNAIQICVQAAKSS